MTPNKACPVVMRGSGSSAAVLAFIHPAAGFQLVKGGIEAGESSGAAALRELYEEAGIEGAILERELGVWQSGFHGQVWSFQLCRALPALPDTWRHRTADDGGHEFIFFWQPLAAEPTDEWHPLFKGALAYLRSVL